jgi:hypothetical protein
MDSSHYRIQMDCVIPKYNINLNYLLCNFCKNVLWQPEKCRECHTHFCRFCIAFCLLKSKKCPNCLLEYNPKSPDTFLKEDLKDLNLKCFYNSNGCNKIIQYEMILKHKGECVYKEINCEECNKKIISKNYHSHIIICKNSLPDNMKIDYSQILVYFKDKLEKIDKENRDDLEKLKKNFRDIISQKEAVLGKLLDNIHKQTKNLEDIVLEKEKIKNQSEEEMKIFNNVSFMETNSKNIINGNANLK